VTSAIKLKSWPASEEKYAYRIGVMSGWKNGGILWINFPEHLEYGDVGMGISRYSDKLEYAWKLQQEGKFAHYEIDSLTAKGVRVEATAKVLEPNQVKFTLKIINNSKDLTLENVKPLLCYQYKTLTGFPQNVDNLQKADNFKYTYVVIDGQIKAMADIPTKNPETIVKGATVKPHPPYRTQFPSKRGGWIDKPLDLALSVVTSEDNKRAVILYGQPGRSMLSNAFIPCLHADPYFGHIRPGETKVGTITAIFIEGNWRAQVKKILEAHRKSQLKDDAGIADSRPSQGNRTSECDNWQKLHLEWIFCDDFEAEQDLRVNYDDSRYDRNSGMSVTKNDAFSGSYSLEQHYVPGQGAGWIIKFIGDNPHLTFPGRKLNEIYFRWYHKFEQGFAGMPQKMARVKVHRAAQDWDGALGVYQWVNKKILCADKRTYLYDQQKFKWLPAAYSSLDFSDSANIGRWICIEARIKLNTPGKSDGIIQYWADGKQILLDTGLPLGNESYSKGLNMVMWDCYWAGKSPKEQSRFYDNLVISTAPIGPVKMVKP
jgi:hypothetical protein